MTTMQEFYDRTVAHLRAMPHRAMMPDGTTCAYGAPDGSRCAVGAHLPPGPWDDFNGAVQDMLDAHPAAATYLGLPANVFYRQWTDDERRMLDFWEFMQEVHDRSVNWSPHGFDGEAELISVASDFGLTYHEKG